MSSATTSAHRPPRLNPRPMIPPPPPHHSSQRGRFLQQHRQRSHVGPLKQSRPPAVNTPSTGSVSTHGSNSSSSTDNTSNTTKSARAFNLPQQLRPAVVESPAVMTMSNELSQSFRQFQHRASSAHRKPTQVLYPRHQNLSTDELSFPDDERSAVTEQRIPHPRVLTRLDREDSAATAITSNHQFPRPSDTADPVDWHPQVSFAALPESTTPTNRSYEEARSSLRSSTSSNKTQASYVATESAAHLEPYESVLDTPYQPRSRSSTDDMHSFVSPPNDTGVSLLSELDRLIDETAARWQNSALLPAVGGGSSISSGGTQDDKSVRSSGGPNLFPALPSATTAAPVDPPLPAVTPNTSPQVTMDLLIREQQEEIARLQAQLAAASVSNTLYPTANPPFVSPPRSPNGSRYGRSDSLDVIDQYNNPVLIPPPPDSYTAAPLERGHSEEPRPTPMGHAPSPPLKLDHVPVEHIEVFECDEASVTSGLTNLQDMSFVDAPWNPTYSYYGRAPTPTAFLPAFISAHNNAAANGGGFLSRRPDAESASDSVPPEPRNAVTQSSKPVFRSREANVLRNSDLYQDEKKEDHVLLRSQQSHHSVTDYPVALQASGSDQIVSASYTGPLMGVDASASSPAVGTLRFANGDVYHGQVFRGMMHGVGTYTVAATQVDDHHPPQHMGHRRTPSRNRVLPPKPPRTLQGMFSNNVYSGWVES
jgi:hypothetical protein